MKQRSILWIALVCLGCGAHEEKFASKRDAIGLLLPAVQGKGPSTGFVEKLTSNGDQDDAPMGQTHQSIESKAATQSTLKSDFGLSDGGKPLPGGGAPDAYGTDLPARKVLHIDGEQQFNVVGTKGGDVLRGNAGDDRLSGGDGNDQLEGNDGADELIGGAGDDLLLGGRGDDRLIPGPGADRVYGGDGDDTLIIYDSCELLVGSIFDGGAGTNTLILPVSLAEAQQQGVAINQASFDQVLYDPSWKHESPCNNDLELLPDSKIDFDHNGPVSVPTTGVDQSQPECLPSWDFQVASGCEVGCEITGIVPREPKPGECIEPVSYCVTELVPGSDLDGNGSDDVRRYKIVSEAAATHPCQIVNPSPFCPTLYASGEEALSCEGLPSGAAELAADATLEGCSQVEVCPDDLFPQNPALVYQRDPKFWPSAPEAFASSDVASDDVVPSAGNSQMPPASPEQECTECAVSTPFNEGAIEAYNVDPCWFDYEPGVGGDNLFDDGQGPLPVNTRVDLGAGGGDSSWSWYKGNEQWSIGLFAIVTHELNFNPKKMLSEGAEFGLGAHASFSAEARVAGKHVELLDLRVDAEADQCGYGYGSTILFLDQAMEGPIPQQGNHSDECQQAFDKVLGLMKEANQRLHDMQIAVDHYRRYGENGALSAIDRGAVEELYGDAVHEYTDHLGVLQGEQLALSGQPLDMDFDTLADYPLLEAEVDAAFNVGPFSVGVEIVLAGSVFVNGGVVTEYEITPGQFDIKTNANIVLAPGIAGDAHAFVYAGLGHDLLASVKAGVSADLTVVDAQVVAVASMSAGRETTTQRTTDDAPRYLADQANADWKYDWDLGMGARIKALSGVVDLVVRARVGPFKKEWKKNLTRWNGFSQTAALIGSFDDTGGGYAELQPLSNTQSHFGSTRDAPSFPNLVYGDPGSETLPEIGEELEDSQAALEELSAVALLGTPYGPPATDPRCIGEPTP